MGNCCSTNEGESNTLKQYRNNLKGMVTNKYQPLGSKEDRYRESMEPNTQPAKPEIQDGGDAQKTRFFAPSSLMIVQGPFKEIGMIEEEEQKYDNQRKKKIKLKIQKTGLKPSLVFRKKKIWGIRDEL